MRKSLVILLALSGIAPMALAATSATATTPEFRLSIKHDGVRTSTGDETLRYSSLWDGGSNETAKVTIAQNGTTLVENLTGEGDRAWSVTQNGTYALTHTTYTNGAVAAVLNATFVVTGKDVPFPEGDVTVTGWSGTYDGEGHGITVTAPEGSTIRYARSTEGPYGANPSFTNVCGATTIWCEVTKAGYIPCTNSATVVINKREVTLTSGSGAKAYNGIALTNWTYTVSGDDFVGDEGVTCTYSGTQTIVGSSKNAFDYALKSGTSADNYTISKAEGDLTVTSSEIVNPFDPDDPTKPVTPEVLAKANCVTNYDGDGHSIEVMSLLNPLIAANNPQVTYSLLQNGTYEAQNPVFTNVVSTSVWYRIAADNFKPFTTNALLTIAPRSITKATMAAIADQTYAGLAITPVPTVSDERTLIGVAEPTNIITTADYEVSYADNVNVGTAKVILSGTNNYEGVVTNAFNITAAPIPFGPTAGITATGYTNAYDGAAHGVTVTATGLKTTATVLYRSNATASWQDASPTYTDVCDTQVWWKVSAPNYQAPEGTIGIKITPRAVTLTSGTKTDFAYDGQPHSFQSIAILENGFVADEGIATSNWATVTTVVQGEVANTFEYAAIEWTKLSNYSITVVTGKIAVVAAEIDPSVVDPVNPDPSDPYAPYSSYDATVVYDGLGHTINTQALYAVTLAGATPSFSFSLESNGVYQTAPFVYTNVGEYVCWYKIEAANYKPFVHQAKLTILKTAYEDCCLTFTSTNAFCATLGGANGWEWDGTMEVSTDMVEWMPMPVGTINAAKDSSGSYVLHVRGQDNTFVRGCGGIKIYNEMEPYYGILYRDALKGRAVSCKGNVESLLDYRLVALGRRSPMCDGNGWGAFWRTFAGFDCLVSSPDLPMEELQPYCYNEMFCDCVALTNMPALPSTALASGCYEGMFMGCTNLRHAADLPASAVPDEGYCRMFCECRSLTRLPRIDALSVGHHSLAWMFGGCTNLCICEVGVGDSWNLAADMTFDSEFWHSGMFLGCNIDFDGRPVPGKRYFYVRSPAPLNGPVDHGGDSVAGGKSDFDVCSVYDGSFHPVDTNDLTKVIYEYYDNIYDYHRWDSNICQNVTRRNAAKMFFAYSLTSNGVYQVEPFAFKDVVATSYWYKITSPGFADYVHEAQVVITNRPVTLTSASDSKEYDGTALTNPNIAISGLGWAEGEGATYDVTGSQTTAGSSANTFGYTLNEGTKASNYLITKVEGTLTVTKKELDDDEDPDKPDPTKPDALSRFDGVAMYDGEGHTFDTNALIKAFGDAMGASFSVYFVRGESGLPGGQPLPPTSDAAPTSGWASAPPVFTNACEEIIWYKVTNPNYADYVHAAKVTVTNRPVTVTSASGNWVFDTTTHETNAVTALDRTSGTCRTSGTDESGKTVVQLWGADTIEVGGFPSITDVGAKPNSFNWAFGSGTLATNYCVSVVTGTLTVTARQIGDDPANWDIRLGEALKYNGKEQSAPIIQVAFRKPDGNLVDVIPSLENDKATDAGNYKVKITASGNYSGTIEKDWAIVERNLMFTSMTTNWVYDGVAHTADVVTVTGDGFVVGEGVTFADFPVVRHVADAATAIENSFTYSWNDGTKAKNYSVKTTFGTVQMAKRAITLTSPTKDKTYDGTALTFDGDEIVATLSGLPGAPQSGWRDEPYAFAHATNAIVWFTVAADYYNTYTGKVEVAIAKRPVTVKTPTKSKAYDGAALTFGAAEVEVSLTGGLPGGQPLPSAGDSGTSVGGDVLGAPLPSGESFVFSDFASITDAGKIDSTCSIAAGANTLLDDYDITKSWGTLTVLASADQITVTAKNGEWTYDAQPHELHEYVAENDKVLLAGDQLVVEFSEDSVVTTPEDGSKGDGIVSNVITRVRVIRTTGGQQQDVSKNYSLAWYGGTLRVVNANVPSEKVKVKSEEVIYDGEGHTVQVTVDELLTSPVTVRYGLTADAVTLTVPPDFTDAGTHTVFYQISAKYYNTYSGSATATVTPRPVTLVSGSATRVYNGQPLKKNEVTVKEGSLDFVKSEGFSATCSGSITGVGGMENLFDYELTGGAKSDNYTIKKEYGWLRVTPAKADPTKVFGTDPIALGWVYDGKSRPFSVTPEFSEPYRMYYTLVPDSESSYAEEVPTFTDATDEPVRVYFKMLSANYEPVYGTGTVHVTKCPVAAPEIPSKPYTGETQIADIEDTDTYLVLENDGGVYAGTYAVVLMLLDEDNYYWEDDKESSILIAEFEITGHKNEWIVQPSIKGWVYGEDPSVPQAQAKYGEVSVRYSGTTADGVKVERALQVTAPGSYVATFTVKETAEYTGLSADVSFAVTKPGDPPPVSVRAINYAGVYDGKGHTIGVEITGGDGTLSVGYALVESGPFSPTAPLFTNACAVAVWYQVTSPNYRTVVGHGTVTISGGPVSADTVIVDAGDGEVSIPSAWFTSNPAIAQKFGTDASTVAHAKTGKTDAAGNELEVWQDFVAGTDPTNPESKFTATVTMENGTPVVTWNPALNGEGVKEGVRTYVTYGKESLSETEWSVVPPGGEAKYNFFQVFVEMPK